MENKVIKKYVDNFIKYKNINLKEHKEYASILKKASEEVLNQFYCNFYDRMYEKLESYDIDKLEIKKNRNSVINKVIMNNGPSWWNISEITFDNTSLKISVEFSKAHGRIFGIVADKEEAKKDFKTIEKDIRSIFMGSQPHRGAWSIYYNINEQNDDPENIAENIYELHKLLKNI